MNDSGEVGEDALSQQESGKVTTIYGSRGKLRFFIFLNFQKLF